MKKQRHKDEDLALQDGLARLLRKRDELEAEVAKLKLALGALRQEDLNALEATAPRSWTLVEINEASVTLGKMRKWGLFRQVFDVDARLGSLIEIHYPDHAYPFAGKLVDMQSFGVEREDKAHVHWFNLRIEACEFTRSRDEHRIALKLGQQFGERVDTTHKISLWGGALADGDDLESAKAREKRWYEEQSRPRRIR